MIDELSFSGKKDAMTVSFFLVTPCTSALVAENFR